MKILIQKNMFWIILAITIVIFWYSDFSTTWNLNDQIGWGWDPMVILWQYIPSFSSSLPIFSFGYGILYFQKKSTNFFISCLHLTIIFFSIFTASASIGLKFLLSICSWILFLINMTSSKS